MNKSPVFTNIGFEFFGPLYVEQSITKHGYVSPLYCSESYTLRTLENRIAKQFLGCLRTYVTRRGKQDKSLLDSSPQFEE